MLRAKRVLYHWPLDRSLRRGWTAWGWWARPKRVCCCREVSGTAVLWKRQRRGSSTGRMTRWKWRWSPSKEFFLLHQRSSLRAENTRSWTSSRRKRQSKNTSSSHLLAGFWFLDEFIFSSLGLGSLSKIQLSNAIQTQFASNCTNLELNCKYLLWFRIFAPTKHSLP